MRSFGFLFGAVAGALITPAMAAQDDTKGSESREAPLVIDILVKVPNTTESQAEDGTTKPVCAPAGSPETDDSEIVVCADPIDEKAYYYSGSPEAARDRYARETAFADVIRAPGVAGEGIFTGPATVGGICGIGLNPCPPPPAIVTDFDALPDTPAGSDAERVAQGLPPLEIGDESPRQMTEFEKQELGLPPPLDITETQIAPSNKAPQS